MTAVRLNEREAWTFARLPALLDRLGIRPIGVVHVGAHRGEEVPVYRSCGFSQVVLVEPNVMNAGHLETEFGLSDDVRVISGACAPDRGTATFHVNRRSVYSGLRPSTVRPTVATYDVATFPLRDVQGDCNVAIVDTQGTELDVVFSGDLDRLDLLIVETTHTRGDNYAAPYGQAVELLAERGWTVAEEWVHDGSGYTDTAFVRTGRG